MIFKDFELIEMNEEQKDSALIDKCIIIATRTKEVNTLQERERTPTETDDKCLAAYVDNLLIDHLLTKAESNSRGCYDFCGFPFYISESLEKYKLALDRESKMKQHSPQADSEPSVTETTAATQTKHQIITAS